MARRKRVSGSPTTHRREAAADLSRAREYLKDAKRYIDKGDCREAFRWFAAASEDVGAYEVGARHGDSKARVQSGRSALKRIEKLFSKNCVR